MPFNIEMTGAQDYQRMVKMALAGYPGTGKTLLASTAPQVFYVFFREQPRIMSIADRYMPHVKVTNTLDDQGRLKVPVWDTFYEVIEYLESERGQDYASVAIDTGDELFQALKEGRKAANRGKFAIQDWGWLGDTYREIINRVIDLPKHVIVTYHLKSTQEGDDGEIIREIALQGQAKDEVPGWFDIVGVLDSWEEETEQGKLLHRGLLTHTTPKYPFAKDHSGKLPKVFEISKNFVGDFDRLHKLIYADMPTSDHEVIEVVEIPPKAPKPTTKTTAETGVPTPQEVAKKKGKADDPTEDKGQDSPDEGGAPVSPDSGPAEDPPESVPAAESDNPPEDRTADSETDEVPAEGSGVPGGDGPAAGKEDTETAGEGAGTEGEGEGEEAVVSQEVAAEAEELVEKELGGVTVEATCEFEVDGSPCGEPLVKRKNDDMGNPVANADGEPILIPDKDLMDLTKIRFRKYMCREHFTEARKK